MDEARVKRFGYLTTKEERSLDANSPSGCENSHAGAGMGIRLSRALSWVTAFLAKLHFLLFRKITEKL